VPHVSNGGIVRSRKAGPNKGKTSEGGKRTDVRGKKNTSETKDGSRNGRKDAKPRPGRDRVNHGTGKRCLGGRNEVLWKGVGMWVAGKSIESSVNSAAHVVAHKEEPSDTKEQKGKSALLVPLEWKNER